VLIRETEEPLEEEYSSIGTHESTPGTGAGSGEAGTTTIAGAGAATGTAACSCAEELEDEVLLPLLIT